VRSKTSSPGRTIVALVPDAFGGRGGIALYLRHFLRSLCSDARVSRVIALPRTISYSLEPMPAKLEYVEAAARGLPAFAAELARTAARVPSAQLVVCGHLHLLPFACVLAGRYRCPVVLIAYGIEAWAPTRHRITNWMARHVRSLVSIRQRSARLLEEWSGMRPEWRYILPNCIDDTLYGMGPKRPDLVQRYGLEGKRVVLTAGRLDSVEYELRKGFDEVIEALPLLADRFPDIRYVVMGDGPDRPRLEQKAAALGVRDRVVFTGYVAEDDKAAHYRLADVLAMPGSNPRFDRYPFRFVYLEALACGVPVVGPRLDDPEEARDPDAQALLIQVDPTDSGSIADGIAVALDRGSRSIHPVLSKYYYPAFESRVREILDDVLA
jgi:phosphatidyl-myo-inositol dimannoside synthase